MFISSTGGFNYNSNYDAHPAPPYPRKSGLAPTNWTIANPTRTVAMVTPRNPSQQTPGETTSPHYQRAGAIFTHRRGSCSADMLESTINELHDGSDKPMHQPINHEAMSMDESVVPANNVRGRAHQQFAHHPFVATAQQQQHMQLGVASSQQQSFAQIPAASAQQPKLQHSILSSMDLMVPSSFSRPHTTTENKNATFSMFKSSSHHTSHTAAAGDLLSMSRSIDTTSVRASEKKRTASYGGQSYRDTIMQGANNGSQFGVQQQNNTATPAMWSLPTPTTNNIVNQVTGGSFSSASQQLQGNEESYQNQMAKRRCRRADSFEMMDD